MTLIKRYFDVIHINSNARTHKMSNSYAVLFFLSDSFCERIFKTAIWIKIIQPDQ